MKKIKKIMSFMIAMILIVSSVLADPVINIPSNRAQADDVEVEVSGVDGVDVKVEKISGDLLTTYINELSEKNGFEFEPSLAINIDVTMDGEPYQALPLTVSVKAENIHGQLWHRVDDEWILCNYTMYDNMAIFEASCFNAFIFGSQKAESEQDIAFDESLNNQQNIALNSDIDDNKGETGGKSELGDLDTVIGAGTTNNSIVESEINIENQDGNHENEVNKQNENNDTAKHVEDTNEKTENDIEKDTNNQMSTDPNNDNNLIQEDKNTDDNEIESENGKENETEESGDVSHSKKTENDTTNTDITNINDADHDDTNTDNTNIENINADNSESDEKITHADLSSEITSVNSVNNQEDNLVENIDSNDNTDDKDNIQSDDDDRIDNGNTENHQRQEHGNDIDTVDADAVQKTENIDNLPDEKNENSSSENNNQTLIQGKGGSDGTNTSSDTDKENTGDLQKSSNRDEEIEEIIDELSDHIPDGMVEAPELKKGLLRTFRSNNTEDETNSDIEIKNLTIQWLTNSTGESEKAGFGTLRTVAIGDTLSNMQFQIDYVMDGNGELPPGAIEIVIPAYIFKTRDGKEMGELTLSVPEDPSYGAEYAWRRSGDQIILTNTHTLAVSSKVMIQGTWRNHKMFRTITAAHEMIDIDSTESVTYAGKSDPLYASLSVVSDLGNVSKTSNTIDATIDTEVAGAYATKSGYNSLNGDYNTYYSSEDAIAGDMPNDFLPEDPDAYIYVKWYISGSAYGSQPYSIETIDTAESEYGCIMLGIDSDYEGIKKSDDGVSIRAKLFEGYTGGNRSAYVWTTYPKSSFDEDGVMYKLQNKQKIIVTGIDDKKSMEKEATASVYVRLPITYTIKKYWDDDNNAAGRRPSSQAFYIQKLHQGSYVPWKTLYAVDDGTGCYTCSWTDDRGINTYSVSEGSTAGGTIGGAYNADGVYVTTYWNYNRISNSSYDADTHTWTFTNRYYVGSGSGGSTQTFSKYTSWLFDDSTIGSTRNAAINELMKGNTVPVTFSTYGSIRNNGDLVYLEDGDYQINGQSVTPDDVDIQSVQLSSPSLYEYGDYDAELEMWGSKNYLGNGNVSVYGLLNDDWIRFGQIIDGVLNAENGAEVSGYTLSFPEKVTKFKIVSDSECDQISISATVTMRVKPSEYIMSLISNEFEKSDSIRLSLSNIAYFKTEKDGTVNRTRSVGDTAYLHGRNYKVAANLTKNFSYVWNDVEERVIQLYVSGTFTQQSNIIEKADYISAVKNGVIPNSKSGTFYDLLPSGVVPDKKSITLSDGDKLVRAYTIPNFRDTGRIMLVMEVEFADKDGSDSSGAGINGYGISHMVSFNCLYPWEEAFTYGFAGIKNIMAFGANEDQIGTIEGWEGEKDDASGKNHCQTVSMLGSEAPLLANLQGRTTPSFVYASASMKDEPLDFYARTSFQKHVSVNDSNYMEDGVVVEDGIYRYRLFVQSATGTHTGDIVFLDNIDRCIVDGEKQWKGKLESIDLSEPRSIGVNPVVYYSTSEDLNLESLNPNLEAGVVKSYLAENWTTQPPEDLSTVTAIAIDCSQDAEGRPFVLPEDKGLMIYLNMRAESGDELTPVLSDVDPSNPELNGHAYNKGWIDCYIKNDLDYDGAENREYKSSSMTSVGVRAFTLHVETEWNDGSNNDGVRPRAVDVELIRNGEPTGQVITLTEPEWKSEFARIPQYDEQGIPYVYTLEEKAHDSEILLARVNDGEWQEFTRNEPLGTDIPDDIKEAFGLSNPEFDEIVDEYVEGCMINRWKDGDKIIDIASVDGSGLTHYVTSFSINDSEAVISNSHATEMTTIQVKKTWDDELPNGTLMRPASIQVRLIANGKYTGDVRTIMEREGAWETEFVTRKYKKGKLIEYTVDEVPVEDFVATYKNGGRNILNTYYPYGDIVVTNTIRNGTSKALDKTFTYVLSLTDQNGNDITEKYVYEKGVSSGKIGSGNTFTLKDGEMITIKNIPSKVHYSITEESLDGFAISVSENTEGSITSGKIHNAKFENIYSAKGQAGIHATNELYGQSLERNQFRFRLYRNENDVLTGIASNDANGDISFNAQRFTEADDGKQYIYYIEEINGGKPAYTYPDNRVYAIVSIEDNGNGTLSCHVETGAEDDMEEKDGRYSFTKTRNNLTFADGHVISGGEWENMKEEERNEALETHGKYVETDSSSFYNSYSASGKVNLIAYKTIPDEMRRFGFVLHMLGGKEISHVVNEMDGTIRFHKLTFDESDIGKEYIYVAREVIPVESNTDPVIYDESLHGYKISVQDNKDGNLSFVQSNVGIRGHRCNTCSHTIKVSFNGSASGMITVQGEADALIDPYGNQLPWDTINYVIDNNTCTYTYNDQTVVQELEEEYHGFFKAVIGEKEYSCYPNEMVTIPDTDCPECNGTGWIFEVTEDGGLPVFENTLKDGVLTVHNIADSGTFHLHLELEDMKGTQVYQKSLEPQIKVNGTIIPGKLRVVVAENGTGFGEWSDDRYVYHIPEGKFVHVKITSGNVVLFEGDTSKKDFTVKYPEINMDVELSVIDSVDTESDDIDVNPAVTLNNIPIIEGAERHEAEITDGEISFTLDGGQKARFVLPAMTKYRISEEQEQGWVLEYQSQVSGMIKPLQETEAVLYNVYRPEMASVTLMATKTLQGQTTEREFTFELLQNNTVVQTVKNSGKYIVFDPLTFTEPGTYEYEICEVKTGDEDIVFDERKVPVTITVTNDNGLSAVATYGREAVFENDYYPGKLLVTNWAYGITNLNKDIQFDFNVKLESKNGQEIGDKVEYYLVNASTGDIMQPDELTEYYTPK